MKSLKKILHYTLPLICFFSMCSTAIAEDTDDDEEFEIVVSKTSNGSSNEGLYNNLCYRYLKVSQRIFESEPNTTIEAMTVGIRLVAANIDTSYQVSIDDVENFFNSGCTFSSEGYINRFNYVEFPELFSVQNTPSCYFLSYTLEMETLEGKIEKEIAFMGEEIITSECLPEMPSECLPETPLGCRYQDSLTLVTLYNSTNGANWTNTWNLNQPIGTWHGVLLNSDGCVEQLKLYSNQLDGTMPPQLGNLNNLTRLWLQNNQLSGSIPPELGNLVNLEQLRLQNNQLSGDLPPSLGNLIHLEYLLAGNNDLTGNIPTELGNLTELLHLWLQSNELSSDIPPSLGNLTKVVQLRLHNNQLTGDIPGELGDMTSLVRLFLKNNQLSGCYVPNLLNLCEQLSASSSSNSYISNGNDFNEPWEDFCDRGTTNCIINGDRWMSPLDFSAMNVKPNPLNSMATIEFTLFEDSNVSLTVLKPNGQVVNQLIQNEQMLGGKHQLDFEAIQLPTGIYYCVLTAGNARQIQKMVIVK